MRRHIEDFEDARILTSEYVERDQKYKCFSTLHDHELILSHMLETIESTPLAEYVDG